MSATRPCCEFSIGMIAQPARSDFTASIASSKLKHGSGRQPGAHSSAALCELAPGAPWKAMACAGFCGGRGGHLLDQGEGGEGEAVHGARARNRAGGRGQAAYAPVSGLRSAARPTRAAREVP